MAASESTKPEVKLIYFDLRGLAEPIRWMLWIAGQPFKDERISLDIWSRDNQAKSVRRDSKPQESDVGIRRSSDVEQRQMTDEEKVAAKAERSVEKLEKRRHSAIEKLVNLKSWVGQLPILYIGDFQLSQVNTVIRYIANKYGFDGKTVKEVAQAEEALELTYELRLCAVAYNDCIKSDTPDFIRHTVFRDFNKTPNGPKKEFMRKQVVESHIPNYFAKFASMIDQNQGKYLIGTRLTYADLALTNCIDVIEDLVDPNCLDAFPNLRVLKEEILSIPEIQEAREARKASEIDGTNVG